MSTAAQDDLRRYTFPKTDDPVVRERQRMIAEWALESSPETREKVLDEGIEKGRLQASRAALRGVLKARHIALGPEEDARIDTCNDLDTLMRWHEQAIVAATAAEALG